jgi:hypothetical protein
MFPGLPIYYESLIGNYFSTKNVKNNKKRLKSLLGSNFLMRIDSHGIEDKPVLFLGWVPGRDPPAPRGVRR